MPPSQDITKNFTESQAPTELAQLLQLPWQSATLLTLTGSVTVQLSKKGKALVQTTLNKSQQQQVHSGSSGSNGNSQNMPQQPPPQQQALQVPELFGSAQQEQQQQQVLINLQHDRVKATPINGNVPDPFLHKIGLQTAEGRIKANMQVGGSNQHRLQGRKCLGAPPVMPCVVLLPQQYFCAVVFIIEAPSIDVEGLLKGLLWCW